MTNTFVTLQHRVTDLGNGWSHVQWSDGYQGWYRCLEKTWEHEFNGEIVKGSQMDDVGYASVNNTREHNKAGPPWYARWGPGVEDHSHFHTREDAMDACERHKQGVMN